MEKLLSVDQLCALLNIKKQTAYNWVSQGRIPYRKLTGKTLRFKESEIMRWIDGQPTTPPPTRTRRRKGTAIGSDFIDRLVNSAKREVHKN
jgi:excisionase family DNA binding protein